MVGMRLVCRVAADTWANGGMKHSNLSVFIGAFDRRGKPDSCSSSSDTGGDRHQDGEVAVHTRPHYNSIL